MLLLSLYLKKTKTKSWKKMPPIEPNRKPNKVPRLFTMPNDSDDVRVRKCLEIIQQALEEYGCDLQISIHYIGNATVPNIQVVPINHSNN